MLKEKKRNILDMENKEIENHVKSFMYINYAVDQVLNKIETVLETGEDLYFFDNDYYLSSILGTIVPDQAGQFLEKEFLEILGFDVDEKHYLENRSDYIRYVERDVMQYLDEWFDLNINSDLEDGVRFKIDYRDGEILEILTVESDYVPQEVEKKFIQGMDMDLMHDIVEGYVCAFKNNSGNTIFVYSVYDVNSDKFYFDSIPEQTKEDLEIDYNPEELDDKFLKSVGMTREDVKNYFDSLYGRLAIIQDHQWYYGEPFIDIKKADNHLEVFNRLNLI